MESVLMLMYLSLSEQNIVYAQLLNVPFKLLSCSLSRILNNSK